MAAFIAAAKAMKQKEATGETSSMHQTMTIQSHTSKIECPFNLDEIFQADIDRFGALKDVIKYIFDQLEKSSQKINTVDTKMV